MRNIIVIFILFLFIGCVSINKYENSLSKLVGKSEDELVEVLGVPNSSYINNNGAKYSTYITNKAKNISTFFDDIFSNSKSREKKCSTTFTIINNKVVSWSYVGNNCKL